MITISNSDGKNWNTEVETRLCKAIAGNYGSETKGNTTVVYIGPFTFWRCQGTGSSSVVIPSSSSAYAAQIMYGMQQGQSGKDSTGECKCVAIAPWQTQLNMNFDSGTAWIVSGIFLH